MGNSKNCNFICFCCTTTCNNRARCLYTTLRGRELLFLNSILKKMCFWCFLLKATFVSEPAALDAGSPEASPKGSPFPTANHVITVSRMAPVNNKALLPKKLVLSVINVRKGWHRTQHVSKIRDPTKHLHGSQCCWDMASGGAPG